jgi:hypothetical protein
MFEFGGVLGLSDVHLGMSGGVLGSRIQLLTHDWHEPWELERRAEIHWGQTGNTNL